ncbi:MAG: glycosyltransferase family 2 protein [Ruthenibacterium sp.]
MTQKKCISIMIPCYNEEENVRAIYEAVRNEMQNTLPQYDYEILFIDNKSKDKTRVVIQQVCAEDKHVKAIFNIKNFGQFNSPYHGLCSTTGDCTIALCADFQDPVEMIPKLVAEWEKGAHVVCAIKTSSKENGFVYFLRSCYYRVIKKMSDVEQIEHFTGFGLYDKSFLDILRSLHDASPFLRGIVAEYAPDHAKIPYEQPQRRAGKTHNNWYSLYDAAMLSFTSYTKVGLRLATFGGFFIAGVSFLVALVYLVMKLVFWQRFVAGFAPMLIVSALLGGVQLFFIGLVGEYILNMNARIIDRPLVIEERRINFDDNAPQIDR